MKPLRFAPSVEAEIEAAGDDYDDQRPGLGSEFLDALEGALQRLVEQPLAHGLVPDTEREEEIRQVVVRRFPYRVGF